MNTKIMMIFSALLMGSLGLFALFFPQEIVKSLGITGNEAAVVGLQFLAALYLGFATMNWMARSALIGGVYGKPISIGNFFHFGVGGITLLKFAIHHPNPGLWVWILLPVYCFFAILFALVFFKNPAAPDFEEASL